MVFLFIGTSNHCIFEDLFSSISSKVWGTEQLDTSCLDHGDRNSQDSHEHGDTHDILALDNLKSHTNFDKIFTLAPLILISKLFLLVSSHDTLQASIVSIDEDLSPRFLKQFIISLTLASQAPPTLA